MSASYGTRRRLCHAPFSSQYCSPTTSLDRLADGRIDCIVSNFDLPNRTGIELLETVRETHPEIPFILYTGMGSEEVASEAITKGLSDYLHKESGTDQYRILANRITNLVSQPRADSTLAIKARQQRVPSLISARRAKDGIRG